MLIGFGSLEKTIRDITPDCAGILHGRERGSIGEVVLVFVAITCFLMCLGSAIEYDESRLEVRNPSHFHNMAIFVHHVAPVPGTSKGKIGNCFLIPLGVLGSEPLYVSAKVC